MTFRTKKPTDCSLPICITTPEEDMSLFDNIDKYKTKTDDILNQVRAVLDKNTVLFSWKNGDVLMLDNMLVAHARTPFEGSRKIVSSMEELRNSF